MDEPDNKKEEACYDNPIFHEEDGKRIPQQNGGTTAEKAPGGGGGNPNTEVCNNSHTPDGGRSRGYSGGGGGHAASEYMHSLPPTTTSPTAAGSDVTFRDHRKRKRRCFLCTACSIVALLVAVGILIYILEDDDRSSHTEITSTAIAVSKVEVNMTVLEGPFSPFMMDYALPFTDASRLLRRAIVFQISDIFSSSDLSYIYNKTDKIRIRNTNGKVSLTIIIQPPPHVTSPTSVEDRITAILIRGFQDTSFIVDPDSVSTKIYAVPTVKPITPGRCHPMTFKGCPNHSGFFSTPNALGHQSEQEVTSWVNKHLYLLDIRCYDYAVQFYCAAAFPECPPDGKRPVLPCEQFCLDVMSVCQVEYEKHNVSIPIHCDELVTSDDPKTCTPSPYIAGKCLPNARQECHRVGFNRTAFPNAIGSETVDGEGLMLFTHITRLQSATHCFKHSLLFACSIITPKCSGKEPPNHYIPPCKSLCKKYKDRCEIFLNIFHNFWPANLSCDSLPDSPDTSVCVGYAEAREPDERACYDGQVQCAKDSSVCIDKEWLCDGQQDCPSNSDEENCARCGPDEQRCSPTTAVCIKNSQGCDGVSHCYEDTDETYCVRVDPNSKEDHLQVRNPENNDEWEEVCEDGWSNHFSNITCRQLGYKQSLATYYTEENKSSLKSIVIGLANGSDPNRIQGFLQKGKTSCPSGKVVQLLCWKAVCGLRPAHVSAPVRVLGGQKVVPGTWPWMVSLHGGSAKKFFCGASIIDAEWILTAAHCIGGADQETKYWTIMTGDTRRDVYSEYRQVREPKRLFRHQKFIFATVENDVALIQLDRPFKLNDYVRALCLPEHPTDPGTRCLVTGWGKAHELAMHYEQNLRQVTVDVTSWGHCYNLLMNSERKAPYELKKSMFCAGGTKAHDACQGDSGGPLVCQKPNTTDEWYQSGIVSWGINCGLPNVPGVYSNLTVFIDWIHQVMANNTKNTGNDYDDTTDIS